MAIIPFLREPDPTKQHYGIWISQKKWNPTVFSHIMQMQLSETTLQLTWYNSCMQHSSHQP